MPVSHLSGPKTRDEKFNIRCPLSILSVDSRDQYMQHLLTLYGRTISLIGVVFLISFGVVALAFTSVRAMEERDQIRQLQHHILQANSTVREFVLSRDPQDAKDTEQWLQSADHVLHDRVRLENYERLHSELHLYLHSINQLIDAYRTRGFYEDDGLEGQIRQRTAVLQEAFRANSMLDEEIELLELRRAEKNYLLRGDGVYADQLHRRVDRLLSMLETRPADDPVRNLGETELPHIQHDFDEVAMVVDKVEFVRSNLSFLADAIGDTLNDVVESESLRTQRFLWISLALVLVSFLLGLLYAMYVANSVVRPLGMLEDVATRIIHGEELTEQDFEATGELQQLSQALRKVAAVIRDQQETEQDLTASSKELQRVNDELEDRAKKLANVVQRLDSAREDAEGTAQIRADFLAHMSHEIRTPLNGIIGMTSLISNEDLRPDHAEVIDVIRTSGESLLTIVNDILDFSKIEAGAVILESEPLDIAVCVENALSMVGRPAARKGLDLSYEIDGSVPTHIMGDAPRLRQILVNLVGNAVKFTEDGEVHVRVYPSDQGRDMVRFAVRDTGIGISAQGMKSLFEPFCQAEVSTTRKFGGTGLGLSISRNLSELMGGRMWVESTVNEGSIFYFDIEAPASERTTEPDEPLTGRVLLVNDRPLFGRSLERLLAGWGIDVLTASSEGEASEILAEHRFDHVFINDTPSGFDGVAVTAIGHSLKAQSKGAQVHILKHLGDGLGEENGVALAKPLRRSVLRELFTGDSGEAVRVALWNGHRAAPDREPSPSSGSSGGAVVLLVEDNIVNQKVGKRMLQKLGLRVDIAPDGETALEKLSETEYPLVFMDMQMPGIDGLETTRRIRAGVAGNHQPYIIALTANATTEDRTRCLEAGMNDYVAKPVHPTVLGMLVERAGIVLPSTPSVNA